MNKFRRINLLFKYIVVVVSLLVFLYAVVPMIAFRFAHPEMTQTQLELYWIHNCMLPAIMFVSLVVGMFFARDILLGQND